MSKASKEKLKCSGFRKSGYWKGYPCGAIPVYEADGKYYCANHLPVINIFKVKLIE